MNRAHRYKPISGGRLVKAVLAVLIGIPVVLFIALLLFLFGESVYKNQLLEKEAQLIVRQTKNVASVSDFRTIANSNGFTCTSDKLSKIECEKTISSGFGFAVKYLTVTAELDDERIKHPITYTIWED